MLSSKVQPSMLTPLEPMTGSQLRVDVAPEVAAGVRSVQVLHRSPPGSSGAPARTLASSNALPVVVRSTVGVDSASATEFTLTMAPPVQPRQRVTVLLSRLSAPVEGETDHVALVLSPIVADETPAATLTVSRDGVPAGDWLVRVQVDGVESLPQASAETFDQPSLTLPAAP